MKTAAAVIVILVSSLSCGGSARIVNMTRPGGYALGERIQLIFAIENSNRAPDSIRVNVMEQKNKYVYEIWAPKDADRYSVAWDGRKPDGSWPAGGRYLVYAFIDSGKIARSDTVEFGLTD